MATKRWKHQLFRAIPSFQLCRHGHHNQIVSGNTVPASIYQMSPVNPKSFDISYPSYSINSNSFAAAAAPVHQVPPSTPEETFFFTAPPPFRRSSKLKPPHHHVEAESLLPESHWKKLDKSRLQAGRDWAAKSYGKKAREETTDAETLLSPETSRSFSEDWLSSTSADIFTDRSGTSTEPYKVVRNYPPETTVAVVKRSENPLEDFKCSMWEMVVEKRLFKPDDLEQLLLSFLSLNSRRYHGVIVEAFSEIWRVMFSEGTMGTIN